MLDYQECIQKAAIRPSQLQTNSPSPRNSTPWKSKDHQIYGLSEKTIVLVRVYNQQFQGTILLTVFDLQGRSFFGALY